MGSPSPLPGELPAGFTIPAAGCGEESPILRGHCCWPVQTGTFLLCAGQFHLSGPDNAVLLL